MRRIILCFFIFAMVVTLVFRAEALETTLFDIRNEILRESNNIKSLIQGPKQAIIRDVIVLNSMFDSCIMSSSQLDAYFAMLGIFNTIKDKDVNETSTKYLIDWLNEMKKANDMNITSLQGMSAQSLDSETKLHMDSLKTYFAELTKKIEGELNKISLIKKSLKIK